MVLVPQGPQILALLALFIRVETRLLKLVIRDRVLHPVDDELDPLLDLGDLLRQGSLAQLHARTRFVDQVDGLVRKEPIRDVPIRMRDRKLNRVIGITHRMELLVAILDTHDDLDRIRLVRWGYLYGLEAPFK